MKRHDPSDTGPVEPKHRSYPPHVVAKRRKYGLPVTPAEHVAYENGETREPQVTPAQMQRTLAAVPPRCSPAFAHVLREIASRVAVVHEREPGSDDDDPTPAWWDR
jgi:hypothetical protein